MGNLNRCTVVISGDPVISIFTAHCHSNADIINIASLIRPHWH